MTKENKYDLAEDVRMKQLFERSERNIQEEKASIKGPTKSIRSFLKKGFTTPVSSGTKKADTKTGVIARKAIHLVSPKSSVVKRLTYQSKKGTSKGRGRPSGTYKVRYLPSGKAVKVPTHVYKKMLSAEKAQMRLAAVQQQAHLQSQADQLAMQQDPRYNQGTDDGFLAGDDQLHEMRVMQAQQEAERARQMAQIEPQEPRQQSTTMKFVSNFGRGLGRLGGSLGAKRPQQVDQYGRVIQGESIPSLMSPRRSQISPQGMRVGPIGGGIKGEPRVTAISTKANLLSVSKNNARRYR